MGSWYKNSTKMMFGLVLLPFLASGATANPAAKPFEAPPVTDSKPLTVVVLRDTTEPARVFKPSAPVTQKREEATESPARVRKVRRSRTRQRIRRIRRADKNWRDQVLSNN